MPHVVVQALSHLAPTGLTESVIYKGTESCPFIKWNKLWRLTSSTVGQSLYEPCSQAMVPKPHVPFPTVSPKAW